MNIFSPYSRKKLLMFCALAAFSAFTGYSNTVQAQSPTAPVAPTATSAEIQTDPSLPVEYPDLTLCKSLKDPNAYVGDDKLAKFVHLGKDGWLYRSTDFRMDYTMPEKTMVYMKRVNDALKKKGVDLYVMLQPARAMLETRHLRADDQPEGYSAATARTHYKALLAELEKNGIHTVDLSDPPADFDYFLRGDLHWNYLGAEWSAQQLSKELLKNPYFRDSKKMEFTSEIVQWLGNEDGLMEKFVEKACGVNWPPERRPTWATTSVVSEASENALFDEVTYPDIAVVGTSNSANEQDFNFVGSLKKALSTDVRNHALSAAGFSGASVVFYASDEFHQHTPKIMVWEFLSHHTFDDYAGFRQMIPAIKGPCEETNAIATASFQIKPPAGYVTQAMIAAGVVQTPVRVNSSYLYGPQLPNTKIKKASAPIQEILVFDNLDQKQINPKTSYLYLEATQPELRTLNVGILYGSGEAEEVDLTRSNRIENNGKYYLEFNQEEASPVMIVQVETEKPEGQIKARICKYDDANL